MGSSNFKMANAYQPKKLAFKFDLIMLNNFIGYLMKKSKQINRKSLINMRRLFDLIDERPYETNPKMDARIRFIKRALEARIDNGIENEGMLINYCRSDSNNPDNEEIINNIERYTRINFNEINEINKIVQDRIQHSYMLEYSPRIYDLAERLDSGDYNSYREINEEMIDLARGLINESRRVAVLNEQDTFSLDDPAFDDNLKDVVTRLKDPARILTTGIRALNQILAPGFHSKRLYMLMGLNGWAA